VDDQGKGNCGMIPRVLGLSSDLKRPLQSVDNKIEAYHSMYQGKNYVPPEYSIVKVQLLGACFIENRIFEGGIIVCVPFENISKHARPTGPHSVV